MKTTRLFFASSVIILAPLLLSVARTSGDNSGSSQYFAFIGTYTAKTDSKGIYSFHFDSGTGRLSSLAVAATTQDPSFLSVARKEKYLYAVNELSDFDGKKSGAVTSYSLDSKSGKLTELNKVTSGGADPCYVSFDQTGKYLLVANYTGGSVSTFPVSPDGRIGPASAFVQHTGSGPDKERQEDHHAHKTTHSPD